MKGRRLRLRRLVALASCAGVTASAPACGGGEESAGAASPLPKREFIAKADRLCLAAGERTHRLIDGLPPFRRLTAPNVAPAVMEQVVPVADRIGEIEQGLETQLRALTPPEDFAPRWDSLLNSQRRRGDLAKRIAAAAADRDRGAYLDAFRRFAQQGSVGTEAVRGYGFEACAIG
jgi:hypothetical protein